MSDITDVQVVCKRVQLHILNLIAQETEPRKLADLTHALNNLKHYFSDTL